MSKFKNKAENFRSAVKRLNEANAAYQKSTENELYQDALIKRFEFTFELAWKTLREFLLDQGYRLEIASPKGVFAYAYQEGFLEDEALWLDMLETRNLTAHDYGREFAANAADAVSRRYAKALSALAKRLAR